MDLRGKMLWEIYKDTEKRGKTHTTVLFCGLLHLCNNLGDFISRISSHRVRCPCVDGCIWHRKISHIGARVANIAGGSACHSASHTLCIPKTQQNSPLLRHIEARWPEGGGCPLCQSSKARLAIFVPLQGQFAVCDLSKGNVTWHGLLTSEEHLGVSKDIGHSYSLSICHL